MQLSIYGNNKSMTGLAVTGVSRVHEYYSTGDRGLVYIIQDNSYKIPVI